MFLLALILPVAGCGGMAPASPNQTLPNRSAACEKMSNEHELIVNVTQEIADEGRLHAALANLEQLPDTLPEARLRKAKILRLLASPDAEDLYRSLLDTCLSAEGHHGLGQVKATQGNHLAALDHLRRAAKLSPADGAIRNDLGLVLLHLRRLPDARFELFTAFELNEASAQPLENLLTLLVYDNKWKEAGELVTRKRLPPEQFQIAEERARALRLEDIIEGRQSSTDTTQGQGSFIKLETVQ